MINANHTSQMWYGTVPDRWTSHRIKTLFDLRDERNYLPLSEVNLISLYTATGVRQHSDIKHTTGNKARNADGYKKVYENDIIVNILLCWMGAIGRSTYQGVTSPAYDIYTPKDGANSNYFHYLFRTPIFSQQCYKAGKGIMSMRWRTYSPQFRNIEVPVPPLTEQKQIVRFLDWKVSGINKLINHYKQEIKALTELKGRMIDDATTKGLQASEMTHNDDVRWDINYPSHWHLQRMREFFSFRKGLSITKANLEESGIPVISYGQVHSKKNSGVGLCDDLIRFVNQSYITTSPSALVEKGDFIFADTSEDVVGCGNCAYIDSEDIIFAGYHSVIAHPDFSGNNKYLAYLFQSSTWRYQIRKKVNAVKVYSITQKILKDVFILIPPSAEQNDIVSYLDKNCKAINDFIGKIEAKIEQLHALKTTLISDVVTGQIDVRNIEVPNYDFVDETADADTDSEDEDECNDEQED